MAKESYDDLVLQLGDLAREHLAQVKSPPRSIQAVFDAEEVLLHLRDELETMDAEMNQCDRDYRDFLERQKAELLEQREITKKWRTAVVGVEARSRDLRKTLSAQKAAHRYQRKSLNRAEDKHNDLELREGHNDRKILLSKENLKKMRLQIMRHKRQLEEIEWELNQVLTPRAGQPGAQGILAHKRILEMEDEAEEKKAEFDDAMEGFDQAIAAKEAEAKEAEELLDDALFALGEECFAARVRHPALNPLYSKLEQLA
jgi:hypothetical protein